MRVLVACEYSATVREAFAKRGHDAWSCDLLPTEIPGQHIQGDVIKELSKGWDLMIAHPPCTRLTNAAIWYIKQNKLQGEVEQAAMFFNALLNADISKICVENPVQHDIAKQFIRQQDQSIQPYNFGENASKRTCLWLKGLPKLKGTSYYPPRIVTKLGKTYNRWDNQTDGGWNRLGPSEDRWKERSRTYQGIADAMAEQWG